MSITTDVPSFISYYETLLSDNIISDFTTYEEANSFLVDSIQKHFKCTLTGVERYRPHILRHGKEQGPPIVQKFCHQLVKLRNQKRTHRRQLLQSLGVATTSDIPLKEIALPKLSTAYPPMGHWIADNPEIYSQWNEHLQTYKLSDQRHHRYTSHLLDPTNLQLDVGPTESVIIYDQDSKDIVGVVVRNFSGNEEVLKWATDILQRSTKVAKSIRVSS